MNIVINGKCSKNCEFCFQDKEFRSKKDMGIKMFKDIVDWLINSHTPGTEVRIALLGGEPTIHPQFDDMLNYIILKQLNSERKIKFLLISNGDNIEKHISKLKEIKNTSILLNISSMLSDEEVLNKLNILTKNNIHFVPSFTVSTYSILNNLKFICDNFKTIEKFRIASASDSLQTSFDYFTINKKYILEAYRYLTKENREISMDCTKIPKCVFTKKEWDDFDFLNVVYRGENPMGASCSSSMGDILPDGTITHCMPLYNMKHEKLKYSDFDNVFQAFTYTHRLLVPRVIEKMEKSDKCKNCIEYKTGRCFAGCLGMDLTP